MVNISFCVVIACVTINFFIQGRLILTIFSFFNIIWDEAEELESLARISHPRIVVNTSGLSAEATELVNLLNREIRNMKQSQIEEMLNMKSYVDNINKRPAFQTAISMS